MRLKRPAKLPTGPLNLSASLELTETQIEAILQWYVKEIHGVDFSKAGWYRDSYGNTLRRYTFTTDLKSEPNDAKVPQKAAPLSIKKSGTIEID